MTRCTTVLGAASGTASGTAASSAAGHRPGDLPYSNERNMYEFRQWTVMKSYGSAGYDRAFEAICARWPASKLPAHLRHLASDAAWRFVSQGIRAEPYEAKKRAEPCRAECEEARQSGVRQQAGVRQHSRHCFERPGRRHRG